MSTRNAEVNPAQVGPLLCQFGVKAPPDTAPTFGPLNNAGPPNSIFPAARAPHRRRTPGRPDRRACGLAATAHVAQVGRAVGVGIIGGWAARSAPREPRWRSRA